MTLNEFDDRYWTNGMTCEYSGARREIVSVDFVERLIGLKSIDEPDIIDMVRCENINDATCPACADG